MKRGMKRGNFNRKLAFLKDVADLVTTIIIIAGLSVAAIVAVGGVTYATKSNAKKSADCIANHSAFNKTTDINDDCKGEKDSNEENNDGGDNGGNGNNNDNENSAPEQNYEIVGLWNNVVYNTTDNPESFNVPMLINFNVTQEEIEYLNYSDEEQDVTMSFFQFIHDLFKYRGEASDFMLKNHDKGMFEFDEGESYNGVNYNYYNAYDSSIGTPEIMMDAEMELMQKLSLLDEEQMMKINNDRIQYRINNIDKKTEDYFNDNLPKLQEDCIIIGGVSANVKIVDYVPFDSSHEYAIPGKRIVCEFSQENAELLNGFPIINSNGNNTTLPQNVFNSDYFMTKNAPTINFSYFEEYNLFW